MGSASATTCPTSPWRTAPAGIWTSGELLDRGPLVLALFRGDWCPYCDLTMAALEEARPAIEALGATAVGIMPDRRDHIARTAARRNIGYLLLSDPANAYRPHLRTCLRSLARPCPPAPGSWTRLPCPAWRLDLAAARARRVRRRAECARGLCLQRCRSIALARSRGAAGVAADAARCPRAIDSVATRHFSDASQGAQGGINLEEEDRTCSTARPPSSPARPAASGSASPRPSPAPAPMSC